MFTHEGDAESAAIFSVEAAGQVYNQMNEFVYLGGNIYSNADLSVGVYWRIHTQRMAHLPEAHPQTVRPTERSPRTQKPDVKSRGTRDNAVRQRRVEPVRVLLQHAAPSPPMPPDSLHRLAKQKSHRPPDFLFGHIYEDGM